MEYHQHYGAIWHFWVCPRMGYTRYTPQTKGKFSVEHDINEHHWILHDFNQSTCFFFKLEWCWWDIFRYDGVYPQETMISCSSYT